MAKITPKIRYTIRFRMMVGFFIIIGIMIAIMFLFNNFFSEKIYLMEKQKNMVSTYNEINTVIDEEASYTSKQEFKNKLDAICEKYDINTLIVDNKLNTVYTNNTNNEIKFLEYLNDILLSGIVFNYYPQKLVPKNNENIPKNQMPHNFKGRIILKTNDNYVLQKYYDKKLGDSVFEIYGVLSNGNQIIIRLELTSIKDNILIMNNIIQIVSILLLFSAVFGAFLISSNILKPIKEVSNVAKKMMELDFDVKYEGKDSTEIGLLGHTMNELASELDISITKLKSLNLELQHDIEVKTNSYQKQKEFLSDVSHELKTPIALIQGYAEALKEGLATDRATINEYCGIIIDEATKMNIMVRQLLSLNEMEIGKITLDIKRFSITKLINSVSNVNLININKKNIDFSFVNKDVEVDVWADPLRIEQVITNFLTNAINYTTENGQIRIWYEKYDKEVRVHIWNSGENIPASQIAHIWDKFYKIDKARKKGNGIGLSIIKAIMNLHNKEVGVNNTKGGVEFYFALDCDKMF